MDALFTSPPVPLMSPRWLNVTPSSVVMLAPFAPKLMSRSVVVVLATVRLPPSIFHTREDDGLPWKWKMRSWSSTASMP